MRGKARQGEALHPQDVRDKDRASETATCLDHTCSLLIPPGDISQGCRLTIPGCHGWVPTISLNHWSFLYLKQLVFRLKMTHFGGFEVSPFGNRPFVSLTDKFPRGPAALTFSSPSSTWSNALGFNHQGPGSIAWHQKEHLKPV